MHSISAAPVIEYTDDNEDEGVVTRLDRLAAAGPYTPGSYLPFFIDYIKPQASRARHWMLTDSRLRDAAKVLDYDDLVQIGSEEVWKLTSEITKHIDDVDPYVFSAWLKVRVESAFRDAITSARVKSAGEIPEEFGGDVRTSVRGPADTNRIVWHGIADDLGTMPTTLCAVLGMFMVEELRQEDIADIAGVGQATISRWIKLAAQRTLALARSHVESEPDGDRPSLPLTSADVLERISAWVGDRYGVPLDTWLEWLGYAYRSDPGYAVDIIGIAHGRMVHRRGEEYDFESDVQQLALLDPPPMTVKDVQDRCGMSYTRAMKVLRVWRHRQG